MHLVDLIRYRLLTTVESSDFSWMEHGQWQRSLVVRFTMSPNAAGRQQNRTRAGLGSWAALCKSIIVFFPLLVGLLGKYYVTKANVTGASGRIFLDGNGKVPALPRVRAAFRVFPHSSLSLSHLLPSLPVPAPSPCSRIPNRTTSELQ